MQCLLLSLCPEITINGRASPTKNRWNEKHGNKNIFLTTAKQAEGGVLPGLADLETPDSKHKMEMGGQEWDRGGLVCTVKIWGHSLWVNAYD